MPRELYSEIDEVKIINAWRDYNITFQNKDTNKNKFNIISLILYTTYNLHKMPLQVLKKIFKLKVSYTKVTLYIIMKYIK